MALSRGTSWSSPAPPTEPRLGEHRPDGCWLALTPFPTRVSFGQPIDACGRDPARAVKDRMGRRRSNRPGTSQAKGPQVDGALESSRPAGRLTEGVRRLVAGISQVP